MNNLEIIWIAVGIALTTATQLRFTSAVGLGEVMLVAWSILVGLRLLINRNNSINTLTRVIFLFWIASLTAMSLGFLIAESNGIASLETDLYHDTVAFIFSSIFCITFSISLQSIKQIKKLLVIFFSLVVVSQVIILVFSPFLSFLKPWYGEIRFSGWSRDPNQLALLFSTIPFFSIHFLRLNSNKYQNVWYIFLIVTSLAFGIATASDSLRAWWSISILVLIFLMMYRNFSKHLTINISGYRAFISNQLILLILLFIALVVGYISYEKVNAVVTDVYNYGSQGNIRLSLWINGIAAMFYSPVFGLGPGPHSGETGALLNWEAHNTFIDWAASTGIIGLTSYVALLGWVGWNAWKNGSPALVATIISLAGYGIFLYTLRHIVFWFYLLAIAILSTKSLNQE